MSDKIRVVAIAFYRTQDQKYLICRRGPAESGAGAWEFPGGKIDAGETEKQALAREIDEELSVNIDQNKLVFIADHEHQYSAKKIHIYLYKYEVVETDPALDFKLIDHDSAVWIRLEEAKNYRFAAADVPFLEKLKSHKY